MRAGTDSSPAPPFSGRPRGDAETAVPASPRGRPLNGALGNGRLPATGRGIELLLKDIGHQFRPVWKWAGLRVREGVGDLAFHFCFDVSPFRRFDEFCHPAHWIGGEPWLRLGFGAITQVVVLPGADVLTPAVS